MSLDFAALKGNSQAQLDKLASELEKLNKPTFSREEDDRFWTPTVDKAGNGSALIRFLPAPPNEELPYVRIFSHGFQGPTGQWYIENNLSTIGKNDPCSELNSKLWNTGLESEKEKARKQKRRTTMISNIYVIKDPGNPENEGKIFLYKYGKKIFDKITDAMNPAEDGIDEAEPINPFCFWKGANFKLVIAQVEGYRNYQKSTFQSSSQLADDDKLEAIWKAEHSLQAFLAADQFKSYDELKARLVTVLGLDSDDAAPVAVPRKASVSTLASELSNIVTDEDPDDEFFKKLKG